MNQQNYYIKISPETIKGDIAEKTLSGINFGYYSGMSSVLSSEILTDMSIPLLFTETFDDMGFYSTFDGFILQKDVVTNFTISGDPTNQYKIYEVSSVPFCFEDYEKVRNNNKIIDGEKEGIIDSLTWNIYNQTADIKFRINEIYTKNLKTKVITSKKSNPFV